jgi:hypothetical protein
MVTSGIAAIGSDLGRQFLQSREQVSASRIDHAVSDAERR